MRRWQKALLIMLALLLLLAVVGYSYLQKTLSALPLQHLQYQISGLSLRQLHLRDVSFALPQPALQVKLSELRLGWRFNEAKLTTVEITDADITLSAWPETAKASADNHTNERLTNNWQLPASLPDSIRLEKLTLKLPCGATQCRYQLALQTSLAAGKLSYQLQLSDSDSAEISRLKLTGQYHTLAGLPVLYSSMTLDNDTKLDIKQQLIASTGDTLDMQGELSMTITPPSPWLAQQLNLWQVPLPDDALSRFTAPVSLRSQWQVKLDAATGFAGLTSSASGRLQLDAQLPSPFALPGIGLLQGQLNADVAIAQGELTEYQLSSNLTLSQPVLPAQLTQLGIKLEQLAIDISSQNQGPVQLNALPVQISLRSQGDSQLTFSGNSTINPAPPLSVMMQDAKLQLAQSQLQFADVSVNGLNLQSQFNAYWLADSWQLDFQQLTAKMATVSSPDISLNTLTLLGSPSQLTGDAAFSSFDLRSELQLQLGQLNHPVLKPQSWQWQGKLAGSLSDFSLQGRLTNTAGLVLAQKLEHRADHSTLSWQLEEIFLLAGNPLAATLNDWPALLELNRGRLSAAGSASSTPALTAQAVVNLSGLSGIYDRSLFKDANAEIHLVYKNGQLTAGTNASRIAEINHGIIAGPLTLTSSYTAKTSSIAAGLLDIQQLQLEVMGGIVRLEPQQLNLSADKQQLQLQLQQLDLGQLLKQHPSTDISGNGRISGSIPLQIGRNGASVENGLIAAESPGGKLQYRPPTAQSMAGTNQGMKVVLTALDDFHYSVLSSNVSYDTSGKLLLALQLQGSNPALENGRPINLNINLEEDIPALITSLQLSSQISDKIKQRVQQKLQQSGARRANGAQP